MTVLELIARIKRMERGRCSEDGQRVKDMFAQAVDTPANNSGLLQLVDITAMEDEQWWPGDMSQDWAGHGVSRGWNAPCGVAAFLPLEKGTPDM